MYWHRLSCYYIVLRSFGTNQPGRKSQNEQAQGQKSLLITLDDSSLADCVLLQVHAFKLISIWLVKTTRFSVTGLKLSL